MSPETLEAYDSCISMLDFVIKYPHKAVEYIEEKEKRFNKVCDELKRADKYIERLEWKFLFDKGI